MAALGPGTPPEAPGIGSLLPPVRLLDLQTNEPSLLVGARGKVVWVVFWSAGSSSSRSLLPRLEAAWKRLKLHRGFTLVAAADATGRDQVRAELAQARADSAGLSGRSRDPAPFRPCPG